MILLINGTIAFLFFKCLNLESLGFTHIAVSPKIVSGLVVAISRYSSESLSIKYFIYGILGMMVFCRAEI